MSRRGRFGKYGDLKRKAIIRRSRLLKAAHGVPSPGGDVISRASSRRRTKSKP